MDEVKIIRDEIGPMLILPDKYSFDGEAWVFKKGDILFIIPKDGTYTEDEVLKMFGE
ncbi:hypothetical protein [Butyrivibrio proteoclasticus]|uniref:hypothetical protein n=1 Tax=Butyrivibrio proteoclasticus TaxID=43305 RepID=UPI000A46B321|nr:hypothetical protein [Butyrivibrio proteoclasticus]